MILDMKKCVCRIFLVLHHRVTAVISTNLVLAMAVRFVATAAVLLAGVADAGGIKPHLLFIVADDQGYANIG